MNTATVPNHWKDARCAKAFWSQHEYVPYQELLADTITWANPAPGEEWLDLGCGQGCLTQALWEKAGARLTSVVGLDIAPNNVDRYAVLQARFTPEDVDRIRFICHDFSSGLDLFDDASFDHAVSGLSISYAESFDQKTGTWTTAAYDRVLREVQRVLRPGGKFVFSVNVPEPHWLTIGLRSAAVILNTRRPLQFLKKSWRMLRYGAWLKQEARRGRFHYLSHDDVAARLRSAGFVDVEHRLSYARQAYIFRARKSPRD